MATLASVARGILPVNYYIQRQHCNSSSNIFFTDTFNGNACRLKQASPGAPVSMSPEDALEAIEDSIEWLRVEDRRQRRECRRASRRSHMMREGPRSPDQPNGIQQVYRNREAPISNINKAELIGKSVE